MKKSCIPFITCRQEPIQWWVGKFLVLKSRPRQDKTCCLVSSCLELLKYLKVLSCLESRFQRTWKSCLDMHLFCLVLSWISFLSHFMVLSCLVSAKFCPDPSGKECKIWKVEFFNTRFIIKPNFVKISSKNVIFYPDTTN